MEGSDATKNLEAAEAFKAKGNEYLKDSKFPEALEEYTKAIDLDIQDGKKAAIYYANRAFTQIKLENYGFAIEDATNAVKKDQTYAKAYFRRASAYFALAKYKSAAANFKRAFDISGDKDSEEKYKLATKLERAKLLADAIAVESVIDQINVGDIVVPESYTGPRLEEDEPITKEW
jgi:serine/threonine-protein phosphatase 5